VSTLTERCVAWRTVLDEFEIGRAQEHALVAPVGQLDEPRARGPKMDVERAREPVAVRFAGEHSINAVTQDPVGSLRATSNGSSRLLMHKDVIF
jgi:hypothetical protein